MPRQVPVCRTRFQQVLGQTLSNKSTIEVQQMSERWPRTATTKGRVSSWRWYPAFCAISACSFMGECGILGLVQQLGSYMWRRIIMNTVRMILCGNVEDSRMNPSEKVGVVSVVFVSTEEEKIKNKLKKLQDKNPEKFYMEYVTPLDVDLTSLEHYPSIEISKNDLQ